MAVWRRGGGGTSVGTSEEEEGEGERTFALNSVFSSSLRFSEAREKSQHESVGDEEENQLT